MISIDLEAGWVSDSTTAEGARFPIASNEAFEIVSKAWLRAGWDAKYVYSFTWMGRPIIQLPEDMIRTQEVIYRVKPDVIVETGIAHGGSLIYYASLCKAMGRGRVIGIDIDIREHNRTAIDAHELRSYISTIEGSSIDPAVVDQVRSLIGRSEKVLVLLDSNHSQDHVLNELRAYSKLVSSGSYIVATDGIMKDLVGAPRSNADWATNNPHEAVKLFVAENPDFVLELPAPEFNEGNVTSPVTYWPGAWLRRK